MLIYLVLHILTIRDQWLLSLIYPILHIRTIRNQWLMLTCTVLFLMVEQKAASSIIFNVT